MAPVDLPSLEAMAERAITRAIRLDPETRRRLAELEGKTILIEITADGPPIRIYVFPTTDGVTLRRDSDRAPDVTLSGPASMFFGRFRDGSTVSEALTIRGDVELGQRLQRVLSRFDPDWEEGLARAIGDVPAHQVARFARTLRAWGRHVAATLGEDGAEYLTEEAMILAKRERVADFLRAVDILRADADRLEQRLQRLHKNS